MLRRVEDLTTGAVAARVRQLRKFLDAITHAADPSRALDWLGKTRNSTGRTVLLDMLHGRVAIDHASLDAAAGAQRGRATSVEFLRRLLVASDVLPSRDEHLSRLERTIAAELARCHPGDAMILQQYATWRVLATTRSRIRAGRSSRAVVPPALANFVVAARFLAWLREHHLQPQTLTATAVESWLGDSACYRDVLAVFLRWGAQRHLVPRVGVTALTTWPPRHLAPAANQLEALRNLLVDVTVPAQDRLVGCLVLLYGQPLTRICQLRLTDVNVLSETTSLRLGGTAVELPPRVADVLREVIADRTQRTTPGVSHGLVPQPIWVFPGRPATQPASAESLRRRLANVGITSVRSARNTALITLAREVPPVVLADLLGLSVGAAVRWRDLSGGTWTSYTAQRPR
ncbi:hypothetical protein GCM10022204_41470 [Microlunatus aurantiacus]|uniref:Site-specific recombinase XerD n=1 Tax=Microlunatus aurantiacus TaxID=446786 RepID=A0ABP7EEI8_9ACTN